MLATGELLENTPLNDLQLHLLTKMNRSGDLLKSLVEGILDFSRIEAGQLRLNSTAFDLQAMVADAADIYRSRAAATGMRLRLAVDPITTTRRPAGRLSGLLALIVDDNDTNRVILTEQLGA